ncbi:MAG: crossover junction endodeoxyribonuclease RuvC [Anaerolineales bacterium]|nr:crossover junction endodeoxyribonuclease RuvC [Anaerolineales bacterium]
MVVIGIDPGVAITGYGLVREDGQGQLALVEFGVIQTPASQAMPDRLLELHQRLGELLRFHRPESGAVEKLFFQRNVRTAMNVGHARGVALLALSQAGVQVAEYTPMEVKQAVTGYGGADKRQVQSMVRMLLDLEAIPQPDDAADALAVAICHLHAARSLSAYRQAGRNEEH